MNHTKQAELHLQLTTTVLVDITIQKPYLQNIIIAWYCYALAYTNVTQGKLNIAKVCEILA